MPTNTNPATCSREVLAALVAAMLCVCGADGGDELCVCGAD